MDLVNDGGWWWAALLTNIGGEHEASVLFRLGNTGALDGAWFLGGVLNVGSFFKMLLGLGIATSGAAMSILLPVMTSLLLLMLLLLLLLLLLPLLPLILLLLLLGGGVLVGLLMALLTKQHLQICLD